MALLSPACNILFLSSFAHRKDYPRIIEIRAGPARNNGICVICYLLYFWSVRNACVALGLCWQKVVFVCLLVCMSLCLHRNILSPIVWSEVSAMSTDTLNKFPKLYQTNLDRTFPTSASLYMSYQGFGEVFEGDSASIDGGPSRGSRVRRPGTRTLLALAEFQLFWARLE